VVDATGATVDNEAELVAASARFSCPLASSYLAVSVQDLMAADSLRKRGLCRQTDPTRVIPWSDRCYESQRYVSTRIRVAGEGTPRQKRRE